MSEDRLEARFEELEALTTEYAKAHAQAEHLGEYRKSLKALLMRKAETAGHKTAAIQEREAYADPEYTVMLEGLREATEIAVSCKWKLEIAKMRFEAWRTKAANRRAEINLR